MSRRENTEISFLTGEESPISKSMHQSWGAGAGLKEGRGAISYRGRRAAGSVRGGGARLTEETQHSTRWRGLTEHGYDEKGGFLNGFSEPRERATNLLINKKNSQRGVDQGGEGWSVAGRAGALSRSDEKKKRRLFSFRRRLKPDQITRGQKTLDVGRGRKSAISTRCEGLKGRLLFQEERSSKERRPQRKLFSGKA